jgi:hypothetical protein
MKFPELLKVFGSAVVVCGVMAACGKSAATSSPQSPSVDSIRLFSNPGDFNLASVALTGGDSVSYFGRKDAQGLPQQLGAAIVETSDHAPAKRVSIVFDSRGRPSTTTAGDGAVLNFEYVSSTQVNVVGKTGDRTPFAFRIDPSTSHTSSVGISQQALDDFAGGNGAPPDSFEGQIQITCGGSPFDQSPTPYAQFTRNTGPGGMLNPWNCIVLPGAAPGAFSYYVPRHPFKPEPNFIVQAAGRLHQPVLDDPCTAVTSPMGLNLSETAVLAASAAASAAATPAAGTAVLVAGNAILLVCNVNTSLGYIEKSDGFLKKVGEVIDTFEASGTLEVVAGESHQSISVASGTAPGVTLDLPASACSAADAGADAGNDGGTCGHLEGRGANGSPRPTCGSEPSGMPGTKLAGEACSSSVECAPVCCGTCANGGIQFLAYCDCGTKKCDANLCGRAFPQLDGGTTCAP